MLSFLPQSMSAPEKLQKGKVFLQEAGDDLDKLGWAFAAIHEALGDACRERLSEPDLKRQHGIEVQDRGKANWQDLLELMPKYCGWSDRDVKYVRRMNGWRNKVAHEFNFEGTRQDVEKYLSYVEGILSNDNLIDEEDSNEESTQKLYFPNNISHGGAVNSFRFWVKRSDRAVEIYNCEKANIIATNAIEKYNLDYLQNYLVANTAYYNQGCLSFIGLLGICFVITIIGSAFPVFITVLIVIIAFLLMRKLLLNIVDNLFFTTTIKVTKNRIYIGNKPYRLANYFGCVPERNHIPKAYRLYIKPNNLGCIARNLTWHESDEIMRIINKAEEMISEEKYQFSIERRESLIFIKSYKPEMSLVIGHNDKLWQSLCCRTTGNNMVELTESEYRELYSKKLQKFNV